jgi:hypothetical protein
VLRNPNFWKGLAGRKPHCSGGSVAAERTKKGTILPILVTFVLFRGFVRRGRFAGAEPLDDEGTIAPGLPA